MAALCWTVLLTALFLSAGNTLADVDQDWLIGVIEGIKNEFALGDTFSLAVNLPLNQDPNNLEQILQDDPADKVQQAVSEGGVYQGRRVIAAAQTGALSRVLDNIEPFVKSSEGNFLIIYSEESPCGPVCTTNVNEDAIAAKINQVVQHWPGYAFVFSKVSDVPAEDMSQLSQSFKQLDISNLGLDHIFRCFGDDSFQCTSCSSDGDVTPSCVANNAPSNQEADKGTSLDGFLGTGLVEGRGGHRGEGEHGGLSKCKGRKGGCKDKGGVRRGKGRKGKKGVGRGKGRKGKKGVGRGKGRKGKKGVGRGKGRKGKKGVGRGKGRKGKKGVGRGKGRKGKKGVGRGKGRKGKKGVGRGKGRMGKKGVGRGKGRKGKKGVGRGKGRKGRKGGKKRGGRKGKRRG